MTLEPIVVEITLETTGTAAFDAFVHRINDWWPMDPFSMSQGLLSFEPILGGQIVETSAKGERFVWGHVTAIEKPKRIEIAWYVGSTVDTATQIAVTFDTGEDGTTTVRLVQSGWEALGDKAAQIRPRNDSGWRQILGTSFTEFIVKQSKEQPRV
ncbi:MAG: SRPBCC domain-containing protein [Pseudomonadota bacterium]